VQNWNLTDLKINQYYHNLPGLGMMLLLAWGVRFTDAARTEQRKCK